MTSAQVGLEERNTHSLLLYQDRSHQQDRVAAWFEHGLARGEKVLCATQDPGLVPALTDRGVAVSAAEQRGQFRMLAPQNFLPADTQTALIRGALAEGYAGVRIVVQANEAAAQLGPEQYWQSHRHVARMCASLAVSALCQYDVDDGASLDIDALVRTHPDAVEHGQMRLRRQADRLAVAGEVDLASAEVLTAWLRTTCAQAGGGQEVVVDLSELTFLDVAGCRALATGTAPFRRDAGQVFLRRARGETHKVIDLLGLGLLEGVRLS